MRIITVSKQRRTYTNEFKVRVALEALRTCGRIWPCSTGSYMEERITNMSFGTVREEEQTTGD